MSTPCAIKRLGNRRDGSKNFWCTAHGASATEKYGRRANACARANVAAPQPEDILELDIDSYPGGVAIWGSVPAIYDTTDCQEVSKGVHVHARLSSAGDKVLDGTYLEVRLRSSAKELATISEVEATSYLAATVFGFAVEFIRCTHCATPHLDEDWFSVHPHRVHLCMKCGRRFAASGRGIGNPLARLLHHESGSTRLSATSSKRLNISQRDFPGGIQVWGSSRAVLWTGSGVEETGIHLHAFNSNGERVHDDTFGEVTIDGVAIDPHLARVLTAQSALRYLRGRLAAVRCEKCEATHSDLDAEALDPHVQHHCHQCGASMIAVGRRRLVVSNALCGSLEDLEALRGRQD